MPNKHSAENREKYNEKRRAERAAAAQEVREENAPELMNWKNSKTKARYWAFVMYPESAPENWRDILQKTGLGFAISPLHDSDKDPTEEDKKSHWHVIAVWGNPTTGSAALKVSASVNAVVPVPLNSVKGYYRYLTHKDNPEKHQYAEEEIQHLNGFNILDFVDNTRSEVIAIKRRVQLLIRDNAITEYAELMDFLLDQDMTEEYDVASSNTHFFDKYITSGRHRKTEAEKAKELAEAEERQQNALDRKEREILDLLRRNSEIGAWLERIREDSERKNAEGQELIRQRQKMLDEQREQKRE